MLEAPLIIFDSLQVISKARFCYPCTHHDLLSKSCGVARMVDPEQQSRGKPDEAAQRLTQFLQRILCENASLRPNRTMTVPELYWRQVLNSSRTEVYLLS